MWAIWTSALLPSCAADFLCCQLVTIAVKCRRYSAWCSVFVNLLFVLCLSFCVGVFFIGCQARFVCVTTLFSLVRN